MPLRLRLWECPADTPGREEMRRRSLPVPVDAADAYLSEACDENEIPIVAALTVQGEFMRNVLRSVRLVALLLPLAGWIAAKEPDSRDSSPGRGAGSIKGLEKADHAAQARVTESYGKLPLSFEANRGQVDLDVKFFSRGGGYGIFITPAEAVLSLGSGSSSTTSCRFREYLRSEVLKSELPRKKPVASCDQLPG